MKICIIGAGSTYTPEVLEGLLRLEEEINLTEISLLDIRQSEKKFAILSDFAGRMISKAKSNIKLTPTFDPLEAVSGADFVLNQFRPGLMEGRINDEKIPLKFNLIGQETTGIGGMACGIRAFPFMEKYVNLVNQQTNNAWIINFTNPSGMLTEFIVNYLNYENCIGLCNCPVEFIKQVSATYGCERDEVFMRYYGLNHLSWVDRFLVKGVDKTDEVFELVKLNMENIPDIDYDPDFLSNLRLLPNPYLKYYYNTRKMLATEIEEKRTTGTRGEVILKIEEELLGLYSEKERTTPPEELSKRGGYMYSTVATELIRSLVTSDERTHIVNIKNQGTITDFPDDFVLEIPVIIDRQGAKTIELGAANKAIVGLIYTIKNYERLVIEGYLSKNENLIKQSMLIHPLGPDEAQLEEVWSELKRVNREYFHWL
ncbi:6-phospho-beta-glucosidase [bacterium]|nr:6-phospho-beta-glucosidase [bacterium]